MIQRTHKMNLQVLQDARAAAEAARAKHGQLDPATSIQETITDLRAMRMDGDLIADYLRRLYRLTERQARAAMEIHAQQPRSTELREALRITAALLQAVCWRGRAAEGDTYTIDGERYRIDTVLDAVDRLLGGQPEQEGE